MWLYPGTGGNTDNFRKIHRQRAFVFCLVICCICFVFGDTNKTNKLITYSLQVHVKGRRQLALENSGSFIEFSKHCRQQTSTASRNWLRWLEECEQGQFIAELLVNAARIRSYNSPCMRGSLLKPGKKRCCSHLLHVLA